MSYYKTCPHCGAHLDPGEVCDCIPSLYACLSPKDRAAVDAKITGCGTKQRPPPVLQMLARVGWNRTYPVLIPPPMIPENEEDFKHEPNIISYLLEFDPASSQMGN